VLLLQMLAMLDKEMADIAMDFGAAASRHSRYDYQKAQTLLWSFWCSSFMHAAACSKENAVPYCAVLCCAVLCCAVLCCAVLCCAVLCCAVLCLM